MNQKTIEIVEIVEMLGNLKEIPSDLDPRFYELLKVQSIAYFKLYKAIEYFFKKVKPKLSVAASSPEELFLTILKEDPEYLFVFLLGQGIVERENSKIGETVKKFKKYFDVSPEQNFTIPRPEKVLKSEFLSLAKKGGAKRDLKGERLIEEFEEDIDFSDLINNLLQEWVNKHQIK